MQNINSKHMHINQVINHTQCMKKPLNFWHNQEMKMFQLNRSLLATETQIMCVLAHTHTHTLTDTHMQIDVFYRGEINTNTHTHTHR